MATLDVVWLLSILIGALASSVLLAFSVYTYRRRVTGRALLFAALVFGCYVAAAGLMPATRMPGLLETTLAGSWLLFLLRALGVSRQRAFAGRMRWVAVVAGCSILAFTVALVSTLILDPSEREASRLVTGAHVALCFGALVVMEQILVNTRRDLRSRMRYLNIGLGAYFGFGFIHAGATFALGSSDPALTTVKPAIAALPVPFLIIASLRNPDNPLRLNLSREFVFGSAVLIFGSVILLASALLAYLVGKANQSYGLAALEFLLVAAVTLIFVFAGSARTQAWAQRFIGRHLLPDRYDYRAHWNRVTDQLTESDPDFSLEQQAIRALTSVFHSPGGALWLNQDHTYVQAASLHADWSSPLPAETARALVLGGEELGEIIDLTHQRAPAFSRLGNQPGLRFLVPLVSFGAPFGVIGVSEPLTPVQLSDEDREIVRLTARQITGFLALRYADQSLAEARQFAAMHRVTTFLVHDLKTTSAQLSLVLSNADRHKHNPQFVNDMLDTVANSVERLDRLLHEIRGEGAEAARRSVQLSEILPALIASFAHAAPVPILDHYNPSATIYVDAHRLTNALQHLLQNAVDACEIDDRVSVAAETDSGWLDILVEDNGRGMDAEFIARRLFTPFESTKGVNGMGVGVYQVREFAREMGGDLLVSSTPKEGTRFVLRLPVQETTE